MKIKLMTSQTELLNMKNDVQQRAVRVAKAARDDFNNTLNLIAMENGVRQEDCGKWKLTDDNLFLVTVKPEKIPPKGKGGEKEKS